MLNLTSKIKEVVRSHGFHKVGITTASQPESTLLLEDWLKNNYHGEMTWMDKWKQKRMNIQDFFPGAKSVICVAHNYYSVAQNKNSDQDYKISRYARGHDYHNIMKKKLKSILIKIKSIDPEIDGRLAVDTAPIMEKVWATQAGLGWQGKHSNLITKEFGSWVFLGEIITNKNLIPDKPVQNFCGTCQACIEACPTKAIVKPYVVDARKCISYLTIEYRHKAISQTLQSKMNGWIFGCDICQDVCPWNRFQKQTDEYEYIPIKENTDIDVRALMKLDKEDFKKRFKKSPVLRAGWKDFQRNVKVAMKNRKQK